MSTPTTAPAIIAPLNKHGKVTPTADKAVHILNTVDKATQLAVAITGRGALGKIAKSAVRASVVTLDLLLTAPSLDGSQWGDLLALLVAEFGLSNFSKGMSGKSGCVAYCKVMALDTEKKFLLAKTVKAQDAARILLSRILDAQANVNRLVNVTQAQIDAAKAAQEQAQIDAAKAAQEQAEQETATV